jgi:transposase
MEQVTRIGMDTSKHVFQLHGVNAAEMPILRRKLRRQDMVALFAKLAPTVIAIEAGGASHHWARLLRTLGHEVKLIAPQLVKPYVKRGKNDAADAAALCEAMSRPTMRSVPVKTVEQQAALMLVGHRERLVRQRTQLGNAIRGYAAEFGLTAAKGMAHLEPLLERLQADEQLPPPAYSSLRHRFRNGPLGVKPLEQVSRRRVHASVRGRHDGRHTMPSGEEPTSQSLAAWFRPRGVGPPAVSRLRRFPRPGDGTSREQDGSVPLRSCLLRSRRLRLGGLPPEAELAAVHPQAV